MGEIESDPKDVETSAWKAAELYGFDMSLIEANLRRTRLSGSGRMPARSPSLCDNR